MVENLGMPLPCGVRSVVRDEASLECLSEVNGRLGCAEANAVLRLHVAALAAREGASSTAWSQRRQTYSPGDAVLEADAQAHGFALVVQGQLKVLTSGHPAERPLVVLTAGQTFGQMAERVWPAHATLRALTDCEIWFLEPATPQKTAGTPGTQDARRTGPWRRLGAAFLPGLIGLLLLSLPATRGALAAIPMGVGHWCLQQNAEWCARPAWAAAGLMAPHDAAPALALGDLAFRQGDLARAESAFWQAQEADPTSPEAHNNLGVVYYRRGALEQAVDAFEEASHLEPGSASVQENLGDSFLAWRDYAEAIEHYRVALSLGGPEPETLANLAVAQYQVGEAAEAQRTMEQALAQASDEGMRQQIRLALAALQAAAGEDNTHW